MPKNGMKRAKVAAKITAKATGKSRAPSPSPAPDHPEMIEKQILLTFTIPKRAANEFESDALDNSLARFSSDWGHTMTELQIIEKIDKKQSKGGLSVQPTT